MEFLRHDCDAVTVAAVETAEIITMLSARARKELLRVVRGNHCDADP